MLPFSVPFSIILGSQSPRRKELLSALGFDFEVKFIEVNENFDSSLNIDEVVKFLSLKKLNAFDKVGEDVMIITCDTLVGLNGSILSKPDSKLDAIDMLKKLSGHVHEVYSGVSIKLNGKIESFVERSKVHFGKLDKLDIEFYVENYNALDKAGAYGVQDWIGNIGIKKIEGSYTNVMGLPTERLYKEIKTLALHFKD